MKERSVVAWVLGLLVLIAGGLGSLAMFLGLAAVLLSPEAAAEVSAEISKGELLALFLPATAVLFASLLFTITVAIAGHGVMEGKKWGRNLLLGLCLVNLLWLAGDILFAGKVFGVGEGVETVILLGLFIYFVLPKQAKLFS